MEGIQEFLFSCPYISRFNIQLNQLILEDMKKRKFDDLSTTAEQTVIKSKKEKKQKVVSLESKTFARKPRVKDKTLFSHSPRSFDCLKKQASQYVGVQPLSYAKIMEALAECKTMEHQFIKLRELVQLTSKEYTKRYKFSQHLVRCFSSHHKVKYEGVLYGSTLNGIGFRDSDIDIRIQPLTQIDHDLYEGLKTNMNDVVAVLRNIAYQTTLCCPAEGVFVPSKRCPIAKLNFFKVFEGGAGRPQSYEEGLSYDISFCTGPNLGSFNSILLRFLCYLEPKFHLLATVIRYWSNRQQLIQPGQLSSYALINMLIYFCQTTEPPLLPSINYMNEIYFNHVASEEGVKKSDFSPRQLEYLCRICTRKELYAPSINSEPLSVLVLKFFEFYLQFPYSTQIVSIRHGRALELKEFSKSDLFDTKFNIRPILNIQDPFDLKHNLTSGMQAVHFKKFLTAIRISYENLFQELLNNFIRPQRDKNVTSSSSAYFKEWGLNRLFVVIPQAISKNNK